MPKFDNTLASGRKKLTIYVQTFNMARKPQDIDFSRMIPNPNKYNIIVWGA